VPEDFLDQMRLASEQRWAFSREQTPIEDLWDEAIDMPIPPQLALTGFDLIAEIKLQSPSEGTLSSANTADDAAKLESILSQAKAYEAAGASAISVLTEPTRFGGNLAHLTAVAQAVSIPVMRKDFLIADYQVIEARHAGAGGVLLIARLLNDDDLFEMADLARDLDMFVLIEAFDEPDLARIRRMLITRGREMIDRTPLLVGLNCRDLATLKIDRSRFETLRDAMPAGVPLIAESGVESASDAAFIGKLNYHGVLVGSALMKASSPRDLAQAILREGKAAKRASGHDLPPTSEGGAFA
jgi:indole-3-glycerol phosphate synthase